VRTISGFLHCFPPLYLLLLWPVAVVTNVLYFDSDSDLILFGMLFDTLLLATPVSPGFSCLLLLLVCAVFSSFSSGSDLTPNLSPHCQSRP
jgi:hypothetical protein